MTVGNHGMTEIHIVRRTERELKRTASALRKTENCENITH